MKQTRHSFWDSIKSNIYTPFSSESVYTLLIYDYISYLGLLLDEIPIHNVNDCVLKTMLTAM